MEGKDEGRKAGGARKGKDVDETKKYDVFEQLKTEIQNTNR